MKLDELLKARGLKRVDAAKATGYDKPMISRLTTGHCLPSAQKLTTLCELLDCGVLGLYERGEVDLLKCGRKGSDNAVDHAAHHDGLANESRRSTHKFHRVDKETLGVDGHAHSVVD